MTSDPLRRGAIDCRACRAPVDVVVDLGRVPLADRFPPLDEPIDPGFPLRLARCPRCDLVQLADAGPEEVDGPGAVAPTASATIARHARSLVAELVADGLARPGGRVLETASHGGHLRPFFAEAGIDTVVLERDADRRRRLDEAAVPVLSPDDPSGGFDLIVDFYELAHLPDPRAALAGLVARLAPGGSLVLEVDHLLGTIAGHQFDAIGHGHHTYLTLGWLRAALADLGLTVTDAGLHPVYGGALRIEARAGGAPADPSVVQVLELERSAGLAAAATFERFATAVEVIRRDVRSYLADAVARGRPAVGYGAPARAVTFLNASGIGRDLLAFTVDRSPAKHGRTLAGTGIPIRPPAALTEVPGADVLVLAWNLVDEIRADLPDVERRGGRFVVAIPELVVVGPDGRSPLR